MKVYVRKLRLIWNFRNENNSFKKKSKSNPKRDVAIEMYLSHSHKEILSLKGKIFYSNLTKGGGNVLYLLCDDPSNIVKKVDKGSTVVVWDRKEYLREANSQLSDKN